MLLYVMHTTTRDWAVFLVFTNEYEELLLSCLGGGVDTEQAKLSSF